MTTIFTKVNNNGYKFYKEGSHNEIHEAMSDLRTRAQKKGFRESRTIGDEIGAYIIFTYGISTKVEVHICYNESETKEFITKNKIN